MGKVSIIIPCYKYGHYLEECVYSALNQTVLPFEIIIVDDCSEDDTFETWVNNPPLLSDKVKIRYIYHTENRGLSAARNTGIKAAKGDWILCLDADDTIEPEFIDLTVGIDDIVATFQKEFGASNGPLQWEDHPKHNDFLVNNQIPAGCLFKKEIWEKIGGYDEEMKSGYEDWDFWLRATKEGYSITTVQLYLFNYRVHGDSMIFKTRQKHAEIHAYMMKKLGINR